MKHSPRALAVALVLLPVAMAGCGSSSSTAASPSTSSSAGAAGQTTQTTAGGASTTAGTTPSTSAAPTGSAEDDGPFCNRLAAAVDNTVGFAATVGSPAQAAKLAQVEADNSAILAAAPAGIRAAITKVYGVAELGRQALAGSVADRVAAGKAATAAMSDPSIKAAIAEYSAWVQAHCGALAAKIMSAGT